MKIRTYTNVERKENPHGVDTRKIYDSPEALAIHLTLEPGEKLRRHITPVDVFFYVLEGTGVIEIGDEKMEVTKDTLIESPKKVAHCWYNNSKEILRVLIIKTPKPTQPTKFLE